MKTKNILLSLLLLFLLFVVLSQFVVLFLFPVIKLDIFVAKANDFGSLAKANDFVNFGSYALFGPISNISLDKLSAISINTNKISQLSVSLSPTKVRCFSTPRSLSLLIVRCFSMNGEKRKNNSYSISSAFKDNMLDIFLPSLHNKDEFLKVLKGILDELSLEKNLYRLEYSLFLHTNDGSKELKFYLAPDSGIDPSKLSSNEMMNQMLGMKILYETFKYKGYHLFHSDLLDLELTKDFEYINLVYNKLGMCVTQINEDLDKEGFIE